MKRKLLVLISLWMLVCLLPVEGMAARWGDVVRITARSAVNVRKTASSSAKTLGEVQPENLYVCLGESNGFYKILYTGSTTGYIPTKYASRERGLVANDQGKGEKVDAVVRVTHSSSLNVRSGPGKKFGSIGSAKPGSSYTFLGMDDGWNIIQYSSSKVGYIAANRTTVEVVDGSSGPTASADCDECDGTRVCQTCDGKGYVYSVVKKKNIDCPSCAGLGLCAHCYSNE